MSRSTHAGLPVVGLFGQNKVHAEYTFPSVLLIIFCFSYERRRHFVTTPRHVLYTRTYYYIISMRVMRGDFKGKLFANDNQR